MRNSLSRSNVSRTVLEFLEEKFETSSAFNLAFSTHFILIASALFAIYYKPSKPVEVPFEIYENPVEAAPTVKIPPKAPPKEKPVPKEKPKAVFGASSRSITTTKGGESVKQGNTVAKEFDEDKLDKDDKDSLPIPTEEYLVSAMPVLVSEFRIPYPLEAKKNKIAGPVVMDILIDAEGNVREVKLVGGPGFGLDEAAVTAVQQFKFKPAEMEGKPVAVRIRYIYRFVLES